MRGPSWAGGWNHLCAEGWGVARGLTPHEPLRPQCREHPSRNGYAPHEHYYLTVPRGGCSRNGHGQEQHIARHQIRAFERCARRPRSMAHRGEQRPDLLLCPGLRRSKQRPDLPNLCSHGPARLHVFAGPDPMLEITVAVALGPARASCPTVHTAPCPTSNCCLSTGVTCSRPRSTRRSGSSRLHGFATTEDDRTRSRVSIR
jgi:hypothetical protein